MFIKRFEASDGDLSVYGLWQHLGKDCLLSLWGGVAHIGAVGLAQSRPSLADPERLSATASVYCYLGHKEDSVVKTTSERLAAALNAKVVVVAGLHWDNLQPAEIERVLANVSRLVDQIIDFERTFSPHGG
jgi:hypothetical protein